jgi:hypothetical protein
LNAASSMASSMVKNNFETQRKQKDHYSGLLNSLSCMSLKIENESEDKLKELEPIGGEDSFSDSNSIDLKATLKKVNSEIENNFLGYER